MQKFTSFAEMLSYHAARAPEQLALRCGEHSYTYSQLESAIALRAQELCTSGKTCIGILSDGSDRCLIEIFAAVRAGLQVVMLDESLPEQTLMALMRYTDIDLLYGDAELCGELAPALTAGVENGRGQILFFTSGTTEQAKAVVLTEQSLCASAWNGGEKLPLSVDDTLLCILPLGHVFGFVCGVLWGLSCGGTVALGRGKRYYAADLAYYKPTAVSVVPMLLGFLLQQRAINPELKLVLVGAGDCPERLLNAAKAAGLRVSFGYGLTETSSGVAISVGGDPFAMEICPDDEIRVAEDGEILIHAPSCIMRGYYKKSADTASVLKGGWLSTGDLGRFDEEHRLHITGRKKDMLVLPDGTKLFLPEYELRLSALLGTRELAVALKNGRPVLFLKRDEVIDKNVPELVRDFSAGLPRSQQITEIQYRDEPLPRTATGKLRRWELI